MPGLFDAFPLLFAQAAPGAGAGANPSPFNPTILIYVAVIGFYFYYFLIRPQQKQEKLKRQMLSGMKKNDKVLTASGIYGTVISVDEKEDRVVLRVDDDKGVRMAFTKGSIVRVIDGPTEKNKEKEKATETA